MKEVDALMDRMTLKTSQEWERAAFIGFQVGAGGKKKFGEYLASLGMGKSEDSEPMTPDDELKLLRLINAAFGGTEIISKG